MFISYKYEAKIPFSLKFCRDFFFKNSQKFAKLHMDSQELAKELLRPFDFADRKSWYLSSELFYAFSSKSCDINWISAKMLIHILPRFSLFITRADSMYRAFKKEFFSSYLFDKQGTYIWILILFWMSLTPYRSALDFCRQNHSAPSDFPCFSNKLLVENCFLEAWYILPALVKVL